MTKTFNLTIEKSMMEGAGFTFFIESLNQQVDFYLGKGNWYPVKFAVSNVDEDSILTMEAERCICLKR